MFFSPKRARISGDVALEAAVIRQEFHSPEHESVGEGRLRGISSEVHMLRYEALKAHTQQDDQGILLVEFYKLMKYIAFFKALIPKKVDLHLDETRKLHHTDMFTKQGLIVRRGQPFTVSVQFDHSIDLSRDRLVFQVAAGIKL